MLQSFAPLSFTIRALTGSYGKLQVILNNRIAKLRNISIQTPAIQIMHHPLFNLAVIYSFTKVVFAELTWKKPISITFELSGKAFSFLSLCFTALSNSKQGGFATCWLWMAQKAKCLIIQVYRNKAQRSMHFCIGFCNNGTACTNQVFFTSKLVFTKLHLNAKLPPSYTPSKYAPPHKQTCCPSDNGQHPLISQPPSPWISVSGTTQRGATATQHLIRLHFVFTHWLLQIFPTGFQAKCYLFLLLYMPLLGFQTLLSICHSPPQR